MTQSPPMQLDSYRHAIALHGDKPRTNLEKKI